MNIESKARAGFTSIMLRGGRITKWKGQVASYAPHVGHLQNVSVAAIAAALAFGGSVALPSEALAQDVTVTVTDPQVPVDETNNGNGSLIINAPNGVTGGTTAPGIKATNGPNANDITINADALVTGDAGIVAINNGSGFTSITADRIVGDSLDGVNVTTLGSGVSINANSIEADNIGVNIDNTFGSGNIDVNVTGAVTSSDKSIARIVAGENVGEITLDLGSAFGDTNGINVDSDSVSGGVNITVNGALIVEGTEAFSGTGIVAEISSGTNTGNLSITTGDISAINGIQLTNSGQGFIDVQSIGTILGAGGFGVDATQTGDGNGITINADTIIANDFGVNVGMSDGKGNINITADNVTAVGVNTDGSFILDANQQFVADVTQIGVSIDAGSADAGNIDVSVTDITAGTGIDIDNSGTGSVTITDFDQILALAGQGISVTQDGAGGQGITINGQTIESQTTGVNILASFGQGDIDVDVDSIEVEDGLSSGVSIVASSTGAGNILVNVPDITAGSGIDIINSGEGYALVESFGQILASSGNGISVTQNGAGKGVTINANVIDAASDGIAASLTSGNGGVSISAVDVKAGSNGISTNNNSGGASTILVGGSIDAGDNAINAVNGANASDLTITGTDVAATIIGGASGIYARNNGTGVTLVSVAGAVTGTAGIGIDVQNGGDAKGISISAADVDGRVRGINAVNDGKGNIDISVSGTVNSLLGQGINADNGASGSSLSIKANVINAATSGIIANNDGNYDTSVTTYGAVDAAAGDGIKVTNGATARNLTVDARADVTGGTDGIDVTNNGVGSSEVIVAANVTGKTGNAISVVNNGAATGLTITANNATATIDGDGFGIYAQNSGGGDTKISVAGTVTADRFDGISAFNGGTAGSISISAGDVTGNYNGIAARNYGTGTTTIAVSGTVTGGAGYNGIFAYNGEYTSGTAASATNAGTGLTITSTKVSDIVNGVAVPTISGDNHGIYAKNLGAGATTLSVAGAIKAASGDGIFVENGANSLGVSINVASVSGGDDGIFALNNGANDTVISATEVDGKSGIGIYAKNAATANSISVSALGITALTDGVKVQNDGTGSVTIAVTNTIAAGQDGVDAVNNGAGNLTIFANSIVAGEEGIEAVNTGADLEIEAANILADRNAVLATNNGTGNTTLTLNGNVTGRAGFNAIEATNATTAGDLTINSTAPAVADANGVIPATIKGGANGILAVNDSNKGGSTTITVAGKVVGETRDGINATNAQGSFGLTIDAANVEGAEFGILARNLGTGTTTVTASGAVDGQNQAGISVYNAASTAGLTVSAIDVTGGTFGVVTNHQGGGATNVSVSNFVSGGSEDAIRATNGVKSSDLSITANDVQGAKRGVYATNNGTGNTTLTLNGSVTGGAGFNAIEATNATTAGDLTIVSTEASVADAAGLFPATITGGTNGILAVNNSNKGGSTTITVAGKVVGTTGDGIRAENAAGSATANLTVLAHDVQAGQYGIIALNFGTGATTVVSTGTATGLNEDGIFVYSGGAGDITVQAVNASGKDGIDVSNYGQGSSSKITVTGDVVGTETFGFFASNGTYNGKSAYNLTAEVNNVTGKIDAIHMFNEGTGSIDLTVNGTVLSETEDGIYARVDTSAKNLKVTGTNAAATITGNDTGVYLLNNGTGSTSINIAGTIKGLTGDGISVDSNVNTTGLSVNVAAVTGNDYGINVEQSGSGSTTIIATGDVVGENRSGIFADLGQATNDLTVEVRNGAKVRGGEFGVGLYNYGVGSTILRTTGAVVGEAEDGIFVVNGPTALNMAVEANNVQGGRNGILADNQGTGFTSVSASGTVTGGVSGDGINVTHTGAGQNLTINATKLAVADANGVVAPTVSGGVNGIIAVNNGTSNGANGSSTTVTALGKTVGATGAGISVTNNPGAADLAITANEVVGATTGIFAANNGTGNTSVAVTGNVTGGTGFNAIDVSNGATAKDLTVNASNAAATIAGGVNGIFASNKGTGSTSITAAGKVVGTTGDGINARNEAGTTNLSVNVNNVSGGLNGIDLTNIGAGSTTLSISGNVDGATENGIEIDNEDATSGLSIIANNGGSTISGEVAGINAANRGAGSMSISVAGDIIGRTDDGVRLFNGSRSENLNIVVNNVTGNDDGISAFNNGDGSTSLRATGKVTAGLNGDGIFVSNSSSTTDLSVEAVDVFAGANGIFANNGGSGSTSVKATGAITATTADGINVENVGDSKNLTVEANNVSGGQRGIKLENKGAGGNTSLTVKGNVTGGTGFNAIEAVNATSAKDLVITAANAAATITGGLNGVLATNEGVGGSTAVNIAGSVIGVGNDGIQVENKAGTNGLTLTANNVSGAENGIVAKNGGAGETLVTAIGDVVGTRGTGVDVSNNALATNITVNTAKVTGGAVGIAAINSGSGFTRVTATGDINGNDAGILATNSVNATDLSVAAANVTATKLGVFADNAGKGATSVTLNGNVTGGTGFNAVDVRNGVAAKDMTITAGNAAGKIAGGLNGLNVLNNGKDASTSVSLAGSVAGTVDDGVHVESGADTVNVSVTVKDATGGDEAVEVINRGKGSTTVVASGALVGRDNGLVAANTATGTTLSVTAKDVTGAASGISTNSLGTGATTISVSGKIAGGTGVGISASNAAGTTSTINLAATADVSATSGNAILNNGGNSVLNVANGAGLRGTVRLGDGSDTANFALASTEAFIGITALDGGDNLSAADGFVDTLNLNGVGNYDLVGARVTNWEAININAGTVGFSDAIITAGALNVANGTTLNGGNSLVATANVTVAANGTLQAGNAAGNSRTRIVGNLASAGLVNLSGPAGSTKAGDTLAVTGNFTGNGGQVRLDTVLGGDNSPTDFVSITGNAVGGSLLAINNTGGLGGLTTGDGIRVVQVGGTSDRDAFALLGDDVQAGGFRYDLFLGGIADPNDQDWYLRTVGASDIAATTLSFARLSDDIAMTFLGTLHERVGEQEHLAKRGYQSAGTGGLWGRFVGKGFRERLSSATLGDIKSTGSISGLQMGLDFGRSIKSDGSATFTGAYAGYADGSSNDQNIFRNVARRSGSSDSKGWLTGLYATHYGSTGWYANAVVQATWVDASASARNGVTLETDGRTYLGSVELGKSLKLGNRLAFETQAQLIYGETRFDDARDSAGIANKIRIEDSLTGRVGFRLKTTKDEKYNAAGGLFSGYLKANLWHNLLGSDVRLNTAGVDLGKFEPKKTWVDAGLGTTLTVAKNTELFFDADVEIGLDRKTAAGTGKAGLRINW